MSINWQNVEPRPRLLVLPPAAASLDEAHAAIELWEHYSGKTLDADQRLSIEIMMAESASGRWAARTTGREMSRQNGKGDEIEVVEFYGLTQRGEAILHSAHELITVSSAHERMVSLLNSHPDLRRRVKKVLNGLGQQMIEMRDGSVIQYRTRTNGGGRGLDDISRLVIDEAQHAKPEQLASATPTLLANPNPQMNFAGTGGIRGVSGWWWQIRRRSVTGDPGNFGYLGHTAEELTVNEDGNVEQHPVDVDDRSLWFAVNPALRNGRADIEFFEEQLRVLGPELFAREHLCVWDPDDSASDVGRPIRMSEWSALADPDSLATDESIRVSLDAPPDRRSATFGSAGIRSDGLLHVQVRHHVPPTTGGVVPLKDRVVATAKALTAGHRTSLIIPPGSPARAWLADLVAAGVPIDEMSGDEFAQGCGRISDAVQDGTLRHRGQPEMDQAVEGLAVRKSGDVDVWGRRTSTTNIAPFVAATCALVRVPEVVMYQGPLVAFR